MPASDIDALPLVLVPVGDGRALPRSSRAGSIFPAWKSIASTSEVLPVPRWPTTAMLRIFPGSVAAMARSSSDRFGRARIPILDAAVSREESGGAELSG